MTFDLRPVDVNDVPELGRICYDAFKDISDRHGFPSDFSSIEMAQQVIGLLVQQEDVYGVLAADGERLFGSNYLNMWGNVAGIGPVSVDPPAQGEGIGRRMMDHVVAHAQAEGYEMVRLCQDSFNMQSLALYASLGFETKEPLAYLALSADSDVDPAFRPATLADLDAMGELCESIYRADRKPELEALMRAGFPAFVIERDGVRGYLVGTAIGHGVAQSDDDMLALLNGHGASVPDGHSFVPLRNGALYRKALAAGHRNQKVMNLMAFGPYEEPRGPYCPSVMF